MSRRTPAPSLLLRILPLATLAAVGALLPAAVSAATIAVWDAESHREIARIQPGHRVTLEAGDEVMLRVFLSADESDSGEREYYQGTWSHDDGEAIEVSEINRQKGSAVVTALDGGNAAMSFSSGDLDEDLVLWVRVTGEAATAPPPTPEPDDPIELPLPGGKDLSYSRSGKAVTALYQGILLRAPDAGAQSWVEQIDRGGYRALVNVAASIARSREARVDLYEREDVTTQERVAALYRHLLGREPDVVDSESWDWAVGMIDDGDIAALVEEVVSDQAFRTRFGY